ncbi:alpha/beta hydrolase [Leucobacter rhizosphaerae]|uniref:Alpha/beta hydrolase n=1 Tax=Leucobacter rhizosphaerae TaxID=2932245 RepID=A0ABY4FTF5_9MICO|nr:alpha/beta hydrolase [Leucobacter rhizosphaerae]UOQ59583.1 alpha/beta hydrolase [Leucobacter rhizosphaerae]
MTAFEVSHPDGRGTPIVMIHGVGDSLQSWEEVAGRLDADRPLVRYTLRGHGERGHNAPPPYEMSDFVADLIALLDELGFPRAILAGFSLGGLIAQAATLAHPDRVAGLIVVGSVANRSEAEQQRVLERFREVTASGPLAVARQSVDRWYTPAYLARHPEAREQTLGRMAQLEPECYAAAYRVLATSDFAEHLGAITAPVLAIAGDGDVGSPPHMSKFLARRVQRGSAIVVPGVKHQLLQETPDTIAKEIDQFVRTQEL